MASSRVKPLVIATAGAVLVVGLVAAAFLARPSARTTPAHAPATSQSANDHAAFPAPPRGAVVYARQWGGSAVALGVVPGQRTIVAQASVLGPQGRGTNGLTVSLNGRRAHACGVGCYRATLGGATRTVEVRVRSLSWSVQLPAQWPPADATALVHRASATWRSLQSLTFDERLASDATHAVASVWRIEGPNRAAYQVVRGWGGVVVGDRRWDRAPGATKWVESPQTPLTQPTPPWVGAVDAHVLGSGVVSGRPVWRISFFDPGTPAWFEIVVDRSSYRTLESRMITTAHFMHDVYGRFNTTPAIVPPR